MPYTDTLNIILITIHTIGAEDAGDSKQYTNMHTIKGSKPRQETGREDKNYKTQTAFQNWPAITQS